MTLAPTPPTEVKAAVERLDELVNSKVTGKYACSVDPADVRTILQALSQATEENERLRTSLLATGEAAATHLKRATKAEAERDEALKALTEAVEQILSLAHARWSEVESSDEELVGSYRTLLSRSAQGGGHG